LSNQSADIIEVIVINKKMPINFVSSLGQRRRRWS